VRDTERSAQQLVARDGAKRRRGGRRSADEAAAITEAEDVLEAALRRDVRVRANREGLKAELVFADLDDVRELARRLVARL